MPAITPNTSQAPSTPTDQSNHLHTEPESDSDDEEVGGCSKITWLSHDIIVCMISPSDPNPPEKFEEHNKEYFSRDQVRGEPIVLISHHVFSFLDLVPWDQLPQDQFHQINSTKSTPARSTPAKSTPPNQLSTRSTPAKSTPPNQLSARSTPARSTPTKSTQLPSRILKYLWPL